MMSMIKLSVLASSAIALACMIGAPRSALAGDSCIYQGTTYSDGAAACQAGVRYECDDGDWKSKKQPCASGSVTEKRERIEAPYTQGRVIEKKTEVEERN